MTVAAMFWDCRGRWQFDGATSEMDVAGHPRRGRRFMTLIMTLPDLGLETTRNPFIPSQWRRERDSNPRNLLSSPVFKTGAINRSTIPPNHCTFH